MMSKQTLRVTHLVEIKLDADFEIESTVERMVEIDALNACDKLSKAEILNEETTEFETDWLVETDALSDAEIELDSDWDSLTEALSDAEIEFDSRLVTHLLKHFLMLKGNWIQTEIQTLKHFLMPK